MRTSLADTNNFWLLGVKNCWAQHFWPTKEEEGFSIYRPVLTWHGAHQIAGRDMNWNREYWQERDREGIRTASSFLHGTPEVSSREMLTQKQRNHLNFWLIISMFDLLSVTVTRPRMPLRPCLSVCPIWQSVTQGVLALPHTAHCKSLWHLFLSYDKWELEMFFFQFLGKYTWHFRSSVHSQEKVL